MTVRCVALHDLEELTLDALGDRAQGALPDLDIVNICHRGDLDGRARKEHFVRDVERFAGYDVLMNTNVKFPSERKHTMTRDAGQDR